MQLKTTLQISLAVGLVVMLTTGFYIRDIPDSTQAVHTTTLRVGTSTPIETLDSSTYTSHEAYEALVSTLVGLYRYNGQNKITPAISDGHPTKSKDGLTYVFTLRDFKWSNGDRVTAGDFVYAWRRLANPKTNSRNASRMDFLKNGEAVRTGTKPVTALGVKAINQNHLQVKLNAPTPYLDQLLADAPTLPINQQFAKKLGAEYGNSATHVLSDGPFKISGWSGATDHDWSYVKNPDYRLSHHVKLNQVNFSVTANAKKLADQFTAGKLDYAPLSPDDVSHYTNSNNLKMMSTLTSAYIFFNTSMGDTTNVHLRRAIAQAYDKHLLTQSKLKDGAIPLNGLIPKNLAKSPQGVDYRTDTGNLETYNLTKASQQWAIAKKQLGTQHVSLTLLVADNNTAEVSASFLKGQLEHNLPGLKITIKTVSLAKRVAMEAAGKYQLVFSTWTPADTDPYNFLTFYKTGSQLNITGYTSNKVDRLINQANSNNPTKRWQMIQRTERYLMETEVPSAGVFQAGQAYLLNNRVSRFSISPSGLVNYEYARLKSTD